LSPAWGAFWPMNRIRRVKENPTPKWTSSCKETISGGRTWTWSIRESRLGSTNKISSSCMDLARLGQFGRRTMSCCTVGICLILAEPDGESMSCRKVLRSYRKCFNTNCSLQLSDALVDCCVAFGLCMCLRLLFSCLPVAPCSVSCIFNA